MAYTRSKRNAYSVRGQANGAAHRGRRRYCCFLIKDGCLAGTEALRGGEFNKQIAFGENHCRYLLLINKMRLANVMDVDGSMPAPRRSAAEV